MERRQEGKEEKNRKCFEEKEFMREVMMRKMLV